MAPYVTVTGPKEGAIASGGHGPQGNPIQFPDFPLYSHIHSQ